MTILETLRTMRGAASAAPRTSGVHSGNMGDIVYALPTMRALGIDRLILNLVEDPGIGGRRLTEGGASFLEPLLCAQPHLAEIVTARARMRLAIGIVPEGRGAELSRGLPLEGVPESLLGVDYVLDRFRLQPIGHMSLIEAHARAFGLAIDPKAPFIHLPEPVARSGGILVSLTPRYRHVAIEDLDRMLRGFGKIVLVGSREEQEAFRGLAGDFVEASDALDLARRIAGSDLLIGSPSLPFAIAEGLKHPRLVDVPAWPANAFPFGPKGWILPDVDNARRLIAALLERPGEAPRLAADIVAPMRPVRRTKALQAQLIDPSSDKPLAGMTCPLSREAREWCLAVPSAFTSKRIAFSLVLDGWISLSGLRIEARDGTVLWRWGAEEQSGDDTAEQPESGLLTGSSHRLIPRGERALLSGRGGDERLLIGLGEGLAFAGGERLYFTVTALEDSEASAEASTVLPELRRDLVHTREALAWAEHERGHAEAARHNAEAQLQATLASTSWRLTWPLRAGVSGAISAVRAVTLLPQMARWAVAGELRTRLRERRAQAAEARAQAAEARAPRTPQRRIDEDYAIALPLGYQPAQAGQPGRIAVICHIFHEEMAREIFAALRNIPFAFDVFASTDTEAKRGTIETSFKEICGGAIELRVTPNRGRDIAPKLVGFADVYGRYDYVLHLHSKRSTHHADLADWRRFLLDQLLGSPEIVHSIFELFARQPGIGMVASQHLEDVRRWIGWNENFPAAKSLAARMGLTLSPRRVIDFPSGSMFWARTAALKPLLDLHLGFEDFPPEVGQKDGTLAHAIERLYFLACERAGFNWVKVARPAAFSYRRTIVAIDGPAALDRFMQERVITLTASAR